MLPRCGICKNHGHWQRDCPRNRANTTISKLDAFVASDELCKSRIAEGPVEVDFIQDGSTRIAASSSTRELLEEAGFRWRSSKVGCQGWFRVQCVDDATVLDLVRTSAITVGHLQDGNVCVGDGLTFTAKVADQLRNDASIEWDQSENCGWRGTILGEAALRAAMEEGKQIRDAIEVMVIESADRAAQEFVDRVTRRFCQRDRERPLWVGMHLERARYVYTQRAGTIPGGA